MVQWSDTFRVKNAGNVGKALFYAAVITEVLMVILDKSAYTNPVEGRLFQVTFLLFSMKILTTKYSVKEWIAIFLFGLLGLVSYLVTGRNEILRIVAFIAACKNIDMQNCLKLVFWMTLAGCVLLVTLSVTGIYGAMAITQDFGRGGVETRYALGMGHPNALQCMVWALILLGLYIYAEKMKWYYYFILFILDYATFRLSDSKTSFLIVSITLLLSALMQYASKLREKKWVEWLFETGMVTCVAFSIFLACNALCAKFARWGWRWDKSTSWQSMIAWLDKFLNGRIFALADTHDDQMWTVLMNWSAFGKAENTRYFDLGWVRLFYWYGIIPAAFFVILCLLLIHQGKQQKDYQCMVLVLSFSLYTIFEAHMISVYIGRNYVLFLLGMYVSQMLHLTSEKETYLWNIARS